MERRADLHARQAALYEADANVRLARANRFGNPIVGPAFTYDPTRSQHDRRQINVPLPVANTHRGEIRQSEAEYALAAWQVQQTEVAVRQDVAAALARLDVAERRAAQFTNKLLPDLKQALDDMEKLFLNGDADLLKIVDVQRKLLKARDGYLDALWNVRQARADLLAATGEPVLGLMTPQPK